MREASPQTVSAGVMNVVVSRRGDFLATRRVGNLARVGGRAVVIVRRDETDWSHIAIQDDRRGERGNNPGTARQEAMIAATRAAVVINRTA